MEVTDVCDVHSGEVVIAYQTGGRGSAGQAATACRRPATPEDDNGAIAQLGEHLDLRSSGWRSPNHQRVHSGWTPRVVGRPYERRRRQRRTSAFAVTRRPRYLLPVEGGHGSVPRTANDDEASGPVIDAPRRQEPIASGVESLIIRLGRWLFWVSPSWRQLEAQSEQFARSPTCSTAHLTDPQDRTWRSGSQRLSSSWPRTGAMGSRFSTRCRGSVRIQPTVMDCARSASRRGSRCSPTALFRSVARSADDVFGRLDYLVRESADQPGTRVVEGPSQQNITRILPGGNTSEVAGSRFVTETEASDGQPALTSVVLLTTTSERDVTMRCQVPARLYSSYRGACNQLLSSLTLTR